MTDEERKQAISEHYSQLGKKGAETNKKKGSEYFKWIRSHGKKKQINQE